MEEQSKIVYNNVKVLLEVLVKHSDNKYSLVIELNEEDNSETMFLYDNYIIKPLFTISIVEYSVTVLYTPINFLKNDLYSLELIINFFKETPYINDINVDIVTRILDFILSQVKGHNIESSEAISTIYYVNDMISALTKLYDLNKYENLYLKLMIGYELNIEII